MRNRNILIIVAALAIAGISVLLLNAYLSGVENRVETQAEEQRLTPVVVATRPLEFGEPLTAQNIKLQNFPGTSVPQGAFNTLQQALSNGRVALRPIVPGEPILASKVSGDDGRAVLAANLPEGMRAVSIAVNAISGVAGFVRPGDTVDVILTRKIPGEGATENDLMSDVVMDRVKVLAIDQVASENATEPAVGATATLEVDLFQAQQLAMAARMGTLSLALRNVKATDPAMGRTITSRSIGSNAFYIRARSAPKATPARPNPAPQVVVIPGDRGSSARPAMPSVPAASSGSAAQPQTNVPAATGPSMTVFRGVKSEDYQVGRLGRN